MMYITYQRGLECRGKMAQWSTVYVLNSLLSRSFTHIYRAMMNKFVIYFSAGSVEPGEPWQAIRTMSFSGLAVASGGVPTVLRAGMEYLNIVSKK